eukprot:6542183-Prymnesium_polylepis.1
MKTRWDRPTSFLMPKPPNRPRVFFGVLLFYGATALRPPTWALRLNGGGFETANLPPNEIA